MSSRKVDNLFHVLRLAKAKAGGFLRIAQSNAAAAPLEGRLQPTTRSFRRCGELLLLFFVWCFVLPSAAEAYSFRLYGEREGRLNPPIRMVTQDAVGFFRVASAHGVYRFDGARLDHVHERGAAESEVRWIHWPADGSVWRNGAWNIALAAYAFQVLSSWWQSWPFRAAAAGMLAVLVTLICRSRMRTTQQLHLTRLREIVNQYPGVVFALDREGKFVFTNRQMEEYTAQPPGGLIGRHPHEVLRPTNAAAFESNLERVWAKGEVTAYSETMETPAGKLVFDVRAFPLRRAGGKIESVCCFATDVTERRQLEQERAESVQRYESFVQQSSEAIWRIEYEPPVPVDLPPREFGDACYARGFVREANTTAAEFLRVPLDRLIGCRYEDHVDRYHPSNRESDRRWYQARFQLKDFVTVVTDGRGEKRVLLSNTVGIVEKGCLARTWTAQQDITERRHLEEMITNTARGVSAETGARFFDSLVDHLALSLGADRTLACELLPGGRRARVLAAHTEPRVPPGWEFDLAGTAAAAAVETGKLQFGGFATGTGPELPAAEGEADWLHGAYTVVPLEAAGTVTGFLMVGAGRATGLAEKARPVLEIFASRAAAELGRLRIEREVLRYQGQLKALSARIQQAAEKERTHLAREIHDELGQDLTAIKIGLSNARNRIAKGDTDRAIEEMAELGTLADETVRSVRRLATELRPPVLDQLGLAAAIRWQAKEMQQRLGIPLECRLEDGPVDPEVATTAFRILQESLTNIMRHASASRVDVALQRRGSQLLLSVKDDGIGFEGTPGIGSLGLLGMNERASGVGGRVEIESIPGQGTTVTACLPLRL